MPIVLIIPFFPSAITGPVARRFGLTVSVSGPGCLSRPFVHFLTDAAALDLWTVDCGPWTEDCGPGLGALSALRSWLAACQCFYFMHIDSCSACCCCRCRCSCRCCLLFVVCCLLFAVAVAVACCQHEIVNNIC